MNERVLLANDDAFELITLSEVLNLRGLNIVGNVRTLVSAESLFRSLQPDVIVVDIGFNHCQGVQFASWTRRQMHEVGVVLTTTCSDLRLLGIQAQDVPNSSIVVLKRNAGDIDILCDAIHHAKHARFDDEDVRWVNRFPQSHENSYMNIVGDLTNVQIETLRFLSQGLSNAEIAKARFVSEKAVEQIVARIALTMGLQCDPKRNMRVLMSNEYTRWVGTSTF